MPNSSATPTIPTTTPTAAQPRTISSRLISGAISATKIGAAATRIAASDDGIQRWP